MADVEVEEVRDFNTGEVLYKKGEKKKPPLIKPGENLIEGGEIFYISCTDRTPDGKWFMNVSIEIPLNNEEEKEAVEKSIKMGPVKLIQ